MNNCDGDFELYAAELAYSFDGQYGVDVRLASQRKLTDNTSDDRFARVSPNGGMIAYSSNSSGNWDLAIVDSGGQNISLVLATLANEEAPTWSPDGNILAYASDNDGDYEIYTVTLGRRSIQQLTFNKAQDRWPLWAQ